MQTHVLDLDTEEWLAFALFRISSSKTQQDTIDRTEIAAFCYEAVSLERSIYRIVTARFLG